jgi:hypothetical protein
VPHRARPELSPRHPIHVTLRIVRGLPTLRTKAQHRVVRDALRSGTRTGTRVVHYSVQSNHIHLILEAEGKQSLARGLQGLEIRVAKALNRALDRKGQIFSVRYHARALRTPREVRNALLYVLHNARHHAAQLGVRPARGWVDPCSSATSFDGYDRSPTAGCAPPILPPPETWLLRVGWRRHGLLRIEESPKS